MIDRYFAVMDQIEDDIEDIEKRIFERPDKEVQKDIFSMKRKVAKLKRSIAPKREALRSLVYSDMKQISSETRIYLRDVLDHVMRIDENIDSYRDLISGLMDAYMTQISNNMNATMALLSIIATIMLPLSLLTGVFGMNFEYIPGLKIKWGFWALVGVMLIISIVLIFIFRKKKML